MKVASCSNAACTSSTLVTVDDPANHVGEYAAIAIGIDGFPVISYYDSAASALLFAKCEDSACSARSITVLDSAGDVGLHTSIAIAADGFPLIAYHDATARDLRVVKCANAACSARAVSTVDASTNWVGWYTSIAMGSDGLAVISYYDVTAGALKVAKCGDAGCSISTITMVDEPPNVIGAFTSIAIGSDGFPVISFHDATAGALKLAKCGNPSCRF